MNHDVDYSAEPRDMLLDETHGPASLRKVGFQYCDGDPECRCSLHLSTLQTQSREKVSVVESYVCYYADDKGKLLLIRMMRF